MLRDSPGFPRRGFPGRDVHSFPAAKWPRDSWVRSALGDALQVALLEELRENARGVCVSSEDLRFCRSRSTAGSLRVQLGAFAEFAKSLLCVPAQPPHFPES